MSPSLSTYDPTAKAEWRAAYNEGFEAGKRVAIREMKNTIKNIEKQEAFSTSTSTTTAS